MGVGWYLEYIIKLIIRALTCPHLSACYIVIPVGGDKGLLLQYEKIHWTDSFQNIDSDCFYEWIIELFTQPIQKYQFHQKCHYCVLLGDSRVHCGFVWIYLRWQSKRQIINVLSRTQVIFLCVKLLYKRNIVHYKNLFKLRIYKKIDHTYRPNYQVNVC